MKGGALSPKRTVTTLLSAAVITAGASVLSVGGAATGAPSPSSIGAAQRPAQMTQVVPAKPATSLTLPTTLHLINQNMKTVSPGGASHQITISILTHKSGSAAGGGVYTCVANGQGGYNCDSAFALAGGMIRGRETVSGATLTGKVTGGTGKYAGASGSIKATQGSHGTQNLTISYSTG
jgi:hypothetical protein